MDGTEPARGSQPMGMGRRGFLAVSAGAGASAMVLGQSAIVQAAAAAPGSAPPALTRSLFQPLVQTSFVIAGTARRMKLVEVEDLAGAPAGDDKRFSLCFEGTLGALPSGIYTLTHRRISPVALYLGPVDRGVDKRWYQAVVNRLP